MKAKEYLQQAYRLEMKIQAEMEHIQRLKALATKVTTTMNTQRVGGTVTQSRVEDCICKVLDLQEDVKTTLSTLMTTKQDIYKTIAGIEEGTLNILLTLRYLNYNTWEEIAYKLNYSQRWIHKLHADALAIIDERLKSA